VLVLDQYKAKQPAVSGATHDLFFLTQVYIKN